MAWCSWSPQSHLREPKISPVIQLLCTLTKTGSSFCHSPFLSARWISPVFNCSNAISSNAPNLVGKLTRTSSLINVSFFKRYSIKSFIEISFRSNFFAISLSCGKRAMLPSSFIISTKTPAGSNPAKRAISMVASVCPVRRKTPPFFAFNGKICPGLPRSSGFVFGFTNALTVLERSWAEMPVVHPSPSKSILTVKAVSCSEVLSVTIGCRFNSWQRSSVSGAQIKPLPCILIKFITSGVALPAAVIKSPSFSRSSSSTTIISFPFFISSMALSILSNIYLNYKAKLTRFKV